MAQAEHEPTAPAHAAHPNLAKLVFDAEDCLWEAVDYAKAATQMLEGCGPISADRRSSVLRLIGDASSKMEAVGEAWRELHTATGGDAAEESIAPAAHPVPSDADLVKLAFNRLHSLEDDMDAIGDFCNAIIVGLALEVELENPALGAAIHRIASEIEARNETVWEVHKELFFALNPNRHNPDLIPPIPANDGEEAAGDA